MLPLFFSLPLLSQSMDPATCIKELRQGTLIVRFPTDKPKIDTLTAMVSRSTDPKTKERLEKQLTKAIQERDTLFSNYISAFKNNFDYCPVGYYYDYDGRDLNKTSYYNLDAEGMAVADLSEKPLFYLHFERTTDSKIDALVVYNRSLQIIPDPFPNNFSRGGLNTLFLGLSDKTFPSWRVERMNTQFYKYMDYIMEAEAIAKQREE